MFDLELGFFFNVPTCIKGCPNERLLLKSEPQLLAF